VAQIYVYGTSVRATYYSNFEGTVAATTGADLPLDENAAADLYVNQLVDISVLDSDGNLVCEFTSGEAAPAVEVISNSFTGVNRTTGVSAAGEPTTLQAVLDLWKVSSGAIDFKVLFGGVSTTLQSALAAVAGLFFNVKDPAYGAAGDGSTVDTTAIQNCLTAAGLVRGTVVFPAGTYRITSKLSVPRGVSLWGVGAGGSLIVMDHATNDTLEWAPAIAAGIVPQEVRNLTVAVSQANSGKVINIAGAAFSNVEFYNCVLGSSAGLNTGDTVTVGSAANTVLFDACIIYALAASNEAITADQTNCRVEAKNTLFSMGLGAYNGSGVLVRNGSFTACRFDLSATSSGTNSALTLNGAAGAGPKVTITGCEFIPGTSTSAAIVITNSNESTTSVAESGNIFRAGFTTPYSGFNAQSNLPSMLALTRQALGKNVTDNTAAVTLPTDQYGYVVLTRTTTAAQTLNAVLGPGGAEFTLVVFNNSGGGLGNLTFATTFNAGTPAITGLANGKIAMQHFRCIYANGVAAWNPVAPVISGL
jgi:hypothetical protein